MGNGISKRPFIVAWWVERVRAGRQLTIDTEEKRGPGPWYRTISIAALHDDFVQFARYRFGPMVADSVSIVGFAMILRGVMPEVDITYARINTPAGQVRKRCVRFKNWEHYAAHNSWRRVA